MKKKAQYAVPGILIAFMVLFIIYAIMISPSERAKMIRDELPEEIESPLGEGTRVLFSSGEIFEVGVSAGEGVFSFNLGDVLVSYPARERNIDSREIHLSSSVVSRDREEFVVRNLDMEKTHQVIVRVKTHEIQGEPIISLFINDSRITDIRVTGEVINFIIPLNLLEDVTPIRIEMHHGGGFWSSSKLTGEIELIQVFYSPERTINEKHLTLSQDNMKGNEVRISFVPAEFSDDGNLEISINDESFFSGVISEDGLFTVSQRMDSSGIKVGENVIAFEVEKGGHYNLTNVGIEFIAAPTPHSRKTYSFDLESEDLRTDRRYLVGIKIDRIINPGYIYAQFGHGGQTYYFTYEDLAGGTWAYAEIELENLREFGNNIILNSPNGRFRVTGFMLISA